MKNFVVVAVSLLLVFGAVSAFAEDVPDATLAALGLGGMQVASDAEGMQVRGMSSSAQGTSLSTFTMNLFDPATGANFNFNGADFGRGTDENAGLNATSSAEADSVVSQSSQSIVIEVTDAEVYSATIGGFQIGGVGIGLSPQINSAGLFGSITIP